MAPFASCYRLQLNPYFPLKKAQEYLPYFEELGVEALYLSPILRPVPGSMHGYDICSPHEINPDLGTEEDFLEFAAQAKRCGLKILFDVVANHMSASSYNPWWQDVLENGPKSLYADYFDIDFSPLRKDLKDKVMLPILRTSLTTCMAQGKLGLRYRDGCFFVTVYEYELPMNPSCYAQFLQRPEFAGVKSLLEQDLQKAKGELNRLVLRQPVLYEHIEQALQKATLEEVLPKQSFLLTIWQEGPQGINYRRFFDINELAALRVEKREVFDRFHEKILGYVKEGIIDGLRIDHPDGFYDPKSYFENLKTPYVVVEKILEEEESLPEEWPVAGTVGYEFLNDLNHLFIHDKNCDAFDRIYQKFIGEKSDPEKMIYEAKKSFALLYMPSEINAFTRRLFTFAQPPFSEEELKEGVVELIAHFDVYRTYLRDIDREVYARAFKKMQTPKNVLSFLQEVFFLKKEAYRDFVSRFQQITPPIVAKGLEDTFCYRYNRFVSANEVGGNPTRFGLSIKEFHKRNEKRLRHALITTSTHDTKRCADVRLRLNVLSEMPQIWEEKVQEWAKINRCYKTDLGDVVAPEPNLEYAIYQNLLGAWPHEEMLDADVFVERIRNYFYKAVREAKVYTNWINHNDNYETAVTTFIQQILDQKKNHKFFESFLPFVEKVRALGQLSSLSAIALKVASPGVVDIYQGIELWDDSLVDPDNRRLVDFTLRETLLREDSHPKQRLLKRALLARKKAPELFTEGEYVPVEVQGPLKKHVIAFMRTWKAERALCVAARFFHELGAIPTGDVWKGTELILPDLFEGRDVFTDKAINSCRLEKIFCDHSASLITNIQGSP